jgi:hypothetical protein
MLTESTISPPLSPAAEGTADAPAGGRPPPLFRLEKVSSTTLLQLFAGFVGARQREPVLYTLQDGRPPGATAAKAWWRCLQNSQPSSAAYEDDANDPVAHLFSLQFMPWICFPVSLLQQHLYIDL